jgi:protein involved in polysaccharide export with SLBB domain
MVNHSTIFVRKPFSVALCLLIFLAITVSIGSVHASRIEIVPISPLISAKAGEAAALKESFSDVSLKTEGDANDVNQLSESLTVSSPEVPMKTEEPFSRFEDFIAGNISSTVSTHLKQFGYDLFSKPPLTFAPVTSVPVGPEYVIGPGDELRVVIWGKVEGSWNVIVDRDGNVSLPKVGIIGVTGLTFKEVKDLLYKEFSRYYTSFEMNVSMGALRTLRIYIIGNASRPGTYTISSLSTLVNALFETGGPAKTGTMRDIQIKRRGQTIVHFDLYDFLLEGDKTEDIRLMPEDVIFIPPVGPLAGIAGNVRRPAIYELREDTRLLDLIEMAGGLTSAAFKGRVQWQRIVDHEIRTMFEGDLIDIENNPEKNFTLKDGDLIKLFSVNEAKNTISLEGAVANVGDYGIEPGITRVKDIISKAGGILYYASNSAELTRVRVTPSGPQTEYLNLDISKVMKGDPDHNVPLEINDYILVKTVPGWKLYRKVSIQGEVKYPGIYTIKKGERLSSLIERAGGYTDKAYLRGAVFTRVGVRNIQQKSIDDMIVRLEGELLGQGLDRIATALSKEEAETRKLALNQGQQFIASLRQVTATGRMSIRLAHLRLLKNSQYDIELEEGDSLDIPTESSVVNVVGSVMSQGSFIFADELSYKDYLAMAGGYSRYADEKNVYVLKVDGSARKLANRLVSWNLTKDRWEIDGFGDEIREIEPGDTIVVPEKLDRYAWMRSIKDISQILYQIAVTAGVLIVAF